MTPNPLNYRPSRSAVFYTPPRRLDPRRGVVGVVLGALTAAAAGFLYAIIQRELHHVVFRIGEVIGAALAIGSIAAAVVAYGRVRIPLLSAGVGAVVAIIALYTMWITWLHGYYGSAAIRFTYPWLLGHPISVLRLIRFANDFGTWKYQGESVSGVGLWIIWGLEAIPILLCGVLFPLKAMPGNVPCLTCSTECVLVRPIARFAIECRDDLLARTENLDFLPIAALPAPPHETASQLSLRLMSCPKCGQTNVLTVNHISFTTDHNGSHKINIRPLVNQLMIPPASAKELRDTFTGMVQIREATKDEDQ